MKFGVFSVSMPEYGIAESVQLLKELGYQGVEWRVAEMPEKEPEGVPFAQRYWAYNKSTLELRDIENEAKKAKALGMRVIGYDSYLPQHVFEESGVESVAVEQLLQESDYVTLHVALTDEMRNMFLYMVSLIPGIPLAVGAVASLFYPLSEKRMDEIHKELEVKRAKAAN